MTLFAFHRAAQRILDANPQFRRSGSTRRSVEVADAPAVSRWYRDGAVYVHRESGRTYRPHHSSEQTFIESDTPRRYLVRGGEGSGKSVAGIVKTLERLRRGMSGIMGSPTLVHFRKSLWPEFRRWCPENALVPEHRYRLATTWQPNQPFELVFVTGASLLCGGFDAPGSWEGPNVSFAHYDEARHSPGPGMAKVLDGRCRIAGPRGEAPQWWITTTPRKGRLPTSPEELQFHWLYEMFGPWDRAGTDPFAAFKADSCTITLSLRDNAANLADGYVALREQSLTASEAAVLIDAEWQEEADVQRFLPTMAWWDACVDPTLRGVPLSADEPLVVALDAATGRQSTVSDCFGLVAVTRRGEKVIPRLALKWQATAGEKIRYRKSSEWDEDGPGDALARLVEHHNVLCVTFDPHQLVFVAQQLEEEVWVEPFSQAGERLEADRHLYDQILQHGLAHSGEFDDLRAHIDNADRKVDEDGHRFRLVQGRGKIDLAVCLSMASKKITELNV